jgi:hypothetical protein
MMRQDQDDRDPALQRRWQMIEAKLRAAKSHLVTAGCVVKKQPRGCRAYWSVRYRDRSQGRVCHRAIYLGPPELAEKARNLIHKWREEAIPPEERRRRELLAMLGLTAGARDYSGRARRRLKAAAKEAFGDQRAELQLVYGMRGDDKELRYGRPVGRPPQDRLW